MLTALEKQVEAAAGKEGEPAPMPPPEPEGSPEPQPDGGEEGIHPISPETYESDPQGPTHSTEDRT